MLCVHILQAHYFMSYCCCCLQELTPSPEGYGKVVTLGDFVRDVFLEQVNAMPHSVLT